MKIVSGPYAEEDIKLQSDAYSKRVMLSTKSWQIQKKVKEIIDKTQAKAN